MQGLLEAYPVIGYIGPWLGGALIGILSLVFKNRRPLLTYNVTHQRIGITADDEVHGKVEVRYQGRVFGNLYLSDMEIKNRSINDIENLDIKTYRGTSDILMLTEQTIIEGTLEQVNLTDEYLRLIEADSDWEQQIREAGAAEEPENAKRLESAANFRHGQRHYIVPVLNRGQVVRITYLTTALVADTTPLIHMTCQTKGVRVKQTQSPPAITHLWGVPVAHAAFAGLFFGALIVGVITWHMEGYQFAAWTCFFVGAFANIPGALLIKGYSWLRERVIG